MINFNDLGNIQLGSDCVVFSISPEVYTLLVIKKAALEYLPKACVILDGDNSEILVEIRPKNLKPQALARLQQAAEEFNALLIKHANSEK